MIPGKINHHLLQDLTVLAKANQKGSIVYISKDNKIHSETIFQKLKALIFKNTFSENKKPDSNLSAKNLVIENLENQLRLFVKTDGIQDQDKDALNIAITNIAGSLVDRVIESKNSIKNDVFSELKNLLENYQFTFNGETVKKGNLDRIKDAFITIEGLNASSEKDKLRFMATQINKANEATEKVYIEDIKSISENAAWVKKHKGVASEKALILGKEMNRSELLDLTNNQKFNILQKAIKSLKGKNTDGNREVINIQFSTELAKLAKPQIEQNWMKKNANEKKESDNFIKELNAKQNSNIDPEIIDPKIMSGILKNNSNNKLTHVELYETYKKTIHG
jgi:hypothetical protein